MSKPTPTDDQRSLFTGDADAIRAQANRIRDLVSENEKLRKEFKATIEIVLLADLIKASELALVYMQAEEEEGSDCSEDRSFVEATIRLAKLSQL